MTRTEQSLTWSDKKYLLKLLMKNPNRHVESYQSKLYYEKRKDVSRLAICEFLFDVCQWRGPNGAPFLAVKDMFKPDNTTVLYTFFTLMAHVQKKHRHFGRVKFGGVKLLRGTEVYGNGRVRRCPLTGQIPFVHVPHDKHHTYCITAICSVDPSVVPLYWSMHPGKNTGKDFKENIADAIHGGFLERGDFLVLNEADTNRIYKNIGDHLWKRHGIMVLLLPKEARKLNPIKLFWGNLVHTMQQLHLHNRLSGRPFEIAGAARYVLSNTTRDDIRHVYSQCEYTVKQRHYSSSGYSSDSSSDDE